jgi:hypothetical protein
MCKPWKDGGYSRDSEGFETHSAHVARQSAEVEDVAVSDYPRKKPRVSNIKKRTGKNKPRCIHSWTPWGLEEYHTVFGYPTFHAARYCRICRKRETAYVWRATKDAPDVRCLEHSWVTKKWSHDHTDRIYDICEFCGKRRPAQ